jgi:hypothetical protein
MWLIFRHLDDWSVQLVDGAISVESVIVNIDGSENDKKNILVSWTNEVCFYVVESLNYYFYLFRMRNWAHLY